MHVRSRLAVTLTTAALIATASCSSAEDTAADGDDTTAVETSEPTAAEPTESGPTESGATESEPTTAEPTESEPSTQESPTEDPDGDVVQGTGFTIGLPAGWQDVTDQAAANQPLVDLAIADPGGEFHTNFNVVKPQPFSGTQQQLVEQSAEELRSVTNSPVQPVDPTSFDGVEAPGQTSSLETAQGEVTLIQFMVVREERIHPVTMTFLESNRAEATGTMEQVIASWRWDAG